MANSVNVEKEPKKRGTKIAKKGPKHHQESKYSELPKGLTAEQIRILKALKWK